jgi:ATP-dependent Clp protease ATP-binding subunit ClpA
MAVPEGWAGDIFWPDGHLRMDLLDDGAVAAIREAMRLAQETHWDRLRSPHVFMGLLAVPDAAVRTWGRRLGYSLPKLLEQFQELFHQREAQVEAIFLNREFLSDNAIRLLREAHLRAADLGRTRIGCMDLLVSILTAPQSIVAGCFEHIGLTAAKLTEWAVLAEQQGDPGGAGAGDL